MRHVQKSMGSFLSLLKGQEVDLVVWFILWLPHLSRLQTIKVMHKVKFSGLHTTSDVASLAWFTCPGKDDKRTVHSSPQRLLNFWHIRGTEPIGRNLGFLQGTLCCSQLQGFLT